MSHVALRPHHLLCLLTFAGRGYNPAFTANLEAVAARIGQGAPIVIVDGPDDICAPLLADRTAHCRHADVVARDRRAARDVEAVLGHPVEAGVTLAFDRATIARMRAAFAGGRLRSGCAGCGWGAFCSSLAADGFRAVRLHAADTRTRGAVSVGRR